nr:glycosyltransferase family 4 protein [Actinomycetota bacterium]
RAFRAVAWARSVRHADRVIVISEFVRDRAVEQLGLDPERIRVVYLGVDHERLRPGTSPREEFLLYPARSWPHKNHARLFAAFALLRESQPDLRLVLTGGGTFPTLPDGVESRGHLPVAEVDDLMRRAAVLVFPSLYEGFGLPPIEAMACGCPVACSSTGSLPEVTGGAARLFDPEDPAAIAAGIEDVLRAPEEWSRLGLERAASFSWDRTAREHDAVYAELAG